MASSLRSNPITTSGPGAGRRPFSFIDPRQVKVAVWAATIHVDGDGFVVERRTNRAAYPSDAEVVGVVRLEVAGVPTDATVPRLADAIVGASRPFGPVEHQVHFDARLSQPTFYRRLLEALRERTGGARLSIAALTSRFWTAVLQDYAFSDVTVEVPGATRESTLYVKVRGSGFGDWGLSFVAYLFRGNRSMGCYLACRSGVLQAERVFEAVSPGLEDLREELGDGLDCWENRASRPRVGFRRETRLPFPPEGATNGEFDDAVAWMRDHLDRLVSALHSKLQRMLRDGT